MTKEVTDSASSVRCRQGLGADEESEPWCGKEARKAERESAEALKEKGCALCPEGKAERLLLDVDFRPRVPDRLHLAQGESRESRGRR